MYQANPAKRILAKCLVVVVISVMTALLIGSCLFDTKTNLCDAYELRCAPGQVCAANQPVCINIGGCGDGVVGPGEVCDDGNIINGDYCSSNCKTEQLCGNGVLDLGEQCDTGVGDSPGCDQDCTFVVCGDDYVNTVAGEDCDTGSTHVDRANCNGKFCKSPDCGDSVFNMVAGEGCDTGGDSQACNGKDMGKDNPQSCQIPACGDGYLNPEFAPLGPGTMLKERCDDGNDFNDDLCPSGPGGNCQEARCGDDFVLVMGDAMHPSEQCDDGDPDIDGDGKVNSDTLPDHCRKNCQNPHCGDGVIDLYAPGSTTDDEQCDNGANNSNTLPDHCRTNCHNASCGDGTKDSGEECDAGTNNSNVLPDHCRTNCHNPSCGDGVIDTNAGETCDPNASPSGCTGTANTCQNSGSKMCTCI